MLLDAEAEAVAEVDEELLLLAGVEVEPAAVEAEADEELLLLAGVEVEGLDAEFEGLASSAGAGAGAAKTWKIYQQTLKVSTEYCHNSRRR